MGVCVGKGRSGVLLKYCGWLRAVWCCVYVLMVVNGNIYGWQLIVWMKLNGGIYGGFCCNKRCKDKDDGKVYVLSC